MTATAPTAFRKYAKLQTQDYVRLTHGFCHGLSLDVVAASTGISKKTVRAFYLDLRAKLDAPKYSRWHNMNMVLPDFEDIEQEILIKSTFFDLLAECHFHKSCFRNYELGNRKTRICSKCPLAHKFTDQKTFELAIATSDEVRAFYRTLKIRGEKATDPVRLFRLRLIHTTTINTVRQNSKQSDNGLFDPLETTFLSFGTLLNLMLDEVLAVKT
tara:strand:- start:330 stop:971 length:642 start_codon:yes stop_codon:yes gene_type:complete